MLRQYPTGSQPPPQPSEPPEVTVRELHHAVLIQGGIFLRGSGPVVPGHAPIERQQQHQQQQMQRPQQQAQAQQSQVVVVQNAKRRWLCWRLVVYILGVLLSTTALGVTEGYFASHSITVITACFGFAAALGITLCILTACNVPLVELILSLSAFIIGSVAAGLLTERLSNFVAWLYNFYAGSLAAAWLAVIMWAISFTFAIIRLQSKPRARSHEFDNPNIV